ncbi:sensor histidine kinase [Flaviaesturariibacter aridisoli]|nr:ATP-binding protein [Flaviaesturariibacter aridisoli]
MNAADAILDNLLDAVLVVDAAGTIIYANRAAAVLFGRSADLLLGQPFGYPVQARTVQELELLRGGQLLTAEVLASPIDWQGQRASLLSLRDITAQKRAANELSEQRRRLELTSEENAQFASLASHDLKEPVRKILTYTGRLQARSLPPEEARLVALIETSAQRMRALISGIADLSSVAQGAPAFEHVDLARVLTEVCTDLELLIEEKGAVVTQAGLPEIEGVPGALYQLLLNLVANALKYSRAGVPPRVELRALPAPEGWVEFVASDNGIGFNNEEAAQLFQPFKRLHGKQYEGTGIGLALCQKVVDLHGGSIRAEGRPGEGASFYVRLPLTQESPSPTLPGPSPTLP